MTFDYYVSGLRLHHQVPRFELEGLKNGQAITVTLNEWLQTSQRVILIFSGALDQGRPLLTEEGFKDTQVAYVSALPISTLKALNLKEGLILSDASRDVLESYGAIDERTGAILPSVAIIHSSGELEAYLSTRTLDRMDSASLKALLDRILPN